MYRMYKNLKVKQCKCDIEILSYEDAKKELDDHVLNNRIPAVVNVMRDGGPFCLEVKCSDKEYIIYSFKVVEIDSTGPVYRDTVIKSIHPYSMAPTNQVI